MNWLRSVVQPDPGTSDHAAPVTVNDYDRVGNLRYVTDPRGITKETTYDAMNRPVLTILPPAGGAAISNAQQVWQNFYDDGGLLVGVMDAANVVTEYQYDPRGRKIQETRAYGTPIAVRTRFAYDALDNLRGVQDPRSVETGIFYAWLGCVPRI